MTLSLLFVWCVILKVYQLLVVFVLLIVRAWQVLGKRVPMLLDFFFALEENSKMKKQTSCTYLPCSWLPPSFQNVSYEPIAKINFSVSKLGDTTRTEGSSSSAASKSVKVKVFYSLFKTKK